MSGRKPGASPHPAENPAAEVSASGAGRKTMWDFYSRSFQLYFVYGSDMNNEQIAARCRRPEVFAIARLAGHKIAFFGYSETWDGGEESLIPAPGEDLWGVVYRLSFKDADRLDAWQDIRLDGNGSHFLYPACVKSQEGRSLPVLLIKKNVLGEPQPPSADYLRYILAGAASHGLPAGYIDALKRIPTKKASFPVPKKHKFDRSVLAELSCDCGL